MGPAAVASWLRWQAWFYLSKTKWLKVTLFAYSLFLTRLKPLSDQDLERLELPLLSLHKDQHELENLALFSKPFVTVSSFFHNSSCASNQSCPLATGPMGRAVSAYITIFSA